MSRVKADKPASRLKNLDDLIGSADGIEQPDSGLSSAQTKGPAAQIPKRQLRGITRDMNLADLQPFSGHPFHEYEGERLDDMVESIRSHGVLVPILVRKTGLACEILSGHNRVKAARLAGLSTVPAVVLENISDDEAWFYVVETNLMQRSFTDMSHSEKAAVIAAQHSKLFSQGKRNDILIELANLEKPHNIKENGTSSQVAKKSLTNQKVAEMYSLSKDTVARYLRINKLTTSLKKRLDDGSIPLISAVTLSFLKREEQDLLEECLTENNMSVNLKSSELLRRYSEKEALTKENINLMLGGKIGFRPKPNRTPAVKISKAIYAKYFKPEQSSKEVQEIVRKALELYFKN